MISVVDLAEGINSVATALEPQAKFLTRTVRCAACLWVMVKKTGNVASISLFISRFPQIM